MKALTVAANISTMLAFTLAIQAIAEAWDNFNVTVAESQERVDAVTAKLAELNREKAAFDVRPLTSLNDYFDSASDSNSFFIFIAKKCNSIRNAGNQKVHQECA